VVPPSKRSAIRPWLSTNTTTGLADTEQRALDSVRRMLAEDNPELEPFDQEALAQQRHYLDLDLDEELARLERLRRRPTLAMRSTAAT
jgi:hypothetical protein